MDTNDCPAACVMCRAYGGMPGMALGRCAIVMDDDAISRLHVASSSGGEMMPNRMSNSVHLRIITGTSYIVPRVSAH